MLMRSQNGAPTRLMHGGDLAAARRMFPGAPEPFIDLSTGINPRPYALPALSEDLFKRLPDRAAVERLAAIAADAYGAPGAECVVPAPGTQILLPMVAALVPPGRAAIFTPTYNEHKRTAEHAGHQVIEAATFDQLKGADLAIAVNPNNPDGRIVSKNDLLALADDLRSRNGILVVDEAFADVAPNVSVASEVTRGNIVVLRSFGKFFGLAGLRLGFALASPGIAARIDAALGPWAVSGPAIYIGMKALSDKAWIETTRASLINSARQIDELLKNSRLEILGGTSLYRLTRTPNADVLFQNLGRAGILVRRFTDQPQWLRFGVPANDSEMKRLAAALAASH
ncbi:MAG: threonine-phosphate decarboxylase CobD [Pseudomonadota bacterium]